MSIAKIDASKVGNTVSFAWKQFEKEENRSYPLFESRGKVEAEFVFRCEDKNSGLVEYRDGDKIAGVCCFYTVPQECYFQTVALCAEHKEAIFGLLTYIEREYAGYKAYIGIEKSNILIADALHESGYCLDESYVNLSIDISGFDEKIRSQTIFRVERKNLAAYLKYHASHFGDIWWNENRIAQKFDDWLIYEAVSGGEICGCLFMTVFDDDDTKAEIYGIYLDEGDAALDIINYALNDARCVYPNLCTVYYMAETDELLTASHAAGFRDMSCYCCWNSIL